MILIFEAHLFLYLELCNLSLMVKERNKLKSLAHKLRAISKLVLYTLENLKLLVIKNLANVM